MTRSRPRRLALPRWEGRYRPSAPPILVDITGESVLFDQPALDLSAGGASLESPAPEPAGSRVDVIVHFPDRAPPARLGALVAWTTPGEPGRMGLRWLGLGAGGRRQLEERIARCGARLISPPGHADHPRA